jgi:circadian clock protein KaiC
MTPSPLHTRASQGNLVKTGIQGLDDILGGGLPSNHLYLLEGDPGTGKTTLAMQFLLEGVRQGESGLYITLSESKRELEEVARSHGWTLDGLLLYEMTPEEDLLSSEAQYTVFHPSEVELSDTVSSILEEVEKGRPRRVVFDSLSEMRMLARDPLRYRRQILGLKRFFSGRECTVMLLDDHTTGDDDLQLQSIAHGVLMIQSTDRPYGVKRRRLEVRKLRGVNYREGYHDFSIETGGLRVYPRLVAAGHRIGWDKGFLSSGIAGLDHLLGGGIDRGTSNLLMGPAGCGKSTVAARYAFAATERGEAAAIFCFDEATETLLQRCRELRMDLKPAIAAGKLFVQQIDPAELSPGEFASRVREQVDRQHARVVIIDSLNGFLNAMPDEQYLTLQLHELLSYLAQHGVVTILTMAQHGFMGTSMNSPADVSYLADAVVLFRYFEFEGRIKQAISVVKKRSGAHERTIRELEFGAAGLRVGPALAGFEGILTGIPRFVGTGEELQMVENDDGD